MTSMNHIVIDVSSDEEDDNLVEYSDWLDGVLEIFDEKPKSNGQQKSNSSDPTVDDGDDDCVVLDDDPYKTTTKETAIDTCEIDEVLVIGQKGEIACRDYPHPRHACAKYPFKSTSHQKYCEMCHCYVCDTRAPCAHWCIGFSSIDHCHANDKEQTWMIQRESIRTGKILPRPVSKPQLQRVSQHHHSSSPLNKFGVRSSSTSTRIATHPNTYIRPGYRTDQSRNSLQHPGLQPRAANHRGGSYNGNKTPLAVSSDPFKRTRSPSNKGVYRPENCKHNIAQGSQYIRPTIRNAHPKPLQGNPQQIDTGDFSTPPGFHGKVFNGYVQKNAVPFETPNPPANQQQQQSGISNKVLSEFEDWLMDNTNLTHPVCPLSGQDDATAFTFDLETFIE